MSARAAAVGIGYQLWLRSRWLLLGCGAGVTVLAIVVHLISSPVAAIVVAFLGSLPIGFAAAILVGIVSYSGDLSTTESGFPRHMMVLPLSNRAMALTPLLYGVGCVAALWMIVGRFVLAPAGWPVPLLWPAAMLAALTVWLQATSWMPFWFPFARVAACVAGLFAICAFACIARTFHFSQSIFVGGLLAAMLLAMPVAVRGVARARRGAGTTPPRLALRIFPARAARKRLPFESGGGAQLWLELRRNCTMLPIFILPLPLLTLLMWPWPGHRNDPPPLYLGGFIVPVQVLWAAACLLLPPFMAGAVGANLGKLDAWGKERKMSSFVAVRPMADATLIIAKVKATALTVGLTWAMVLALLLASWSLPRSFSHTESLAHVLIRYATVHRAIIGAVILAFLVLETWLNVVQSFAMALYGRAWLINAISFTVIGVFIGLCGLGAWTSLHPHSLSAVLRGVQIGMLTLVVVKVSLAVIFIRAIRRCRAATTRQLIRWTAAWLLLLGAQFAIVLWLVPRLRHSLLPLTAGLVLSLPYNRLIAMPLAWHHNRHRS